MHPVAQSLRTSKYLLFFVKLMSLDLSEDLFSPVNIRCDFEGKNTRENVSDSGVFYLN